MNIYLLGYGSVAPYHNFSVLSVKHDDPISPRKSCSICCAAAANQGHTSVVHRTRYSFANKAITSVREMTNTIYRRSSCSRSCVGAPATPFVGFPYPIGINACISPVPRAVGVRTPEILRAVYTEPRAAEARLVLTGIGAY